MKKLKLPKGAKEYGLTCKPCPFSDAKPGQHGIAHNGGGISGPVFTQKEVDQFFNAYTMGYHEGKREAFREILKATNTRLGGFY